MKWFKHFSHLSQSGHVVKRAEALFGLAGYAMYFKLCEVFSNHLETMEQDPTIEMTDKQWAKQLNCRTDKLRRFLEELQKQDHIFIEERDKVMRITFPNIREWLSKHAISSKLRSPSGPPRTDQKPEKTEKQQQEQKPVAHAEDNFFWMTEVLRGSNVKRDLPPLAIKHWIKNGIDADNISKIADRVRQQFSSSEKSRRYGEVVVRELRKAYLLWQAYTSLPKLLKHSVDTVFFDDAATDLHVPLEKDKRFIKAYDKCNAKMMDATDIIYVKAKMKMIGNPIPAWVKVRQDLLLMQSKQ